MINTRGCAGAARRAGPGDAEQEARERGLLLGHPAGLREEADAQGAGLLDRQVPVPDAELEGVGAAEAAGAQGVDAPLRQPGDGLHAGVRRGAAAEAHRPAPATERGR